MTRPLRRRHLVTWLVIGPVCVLVLLTAFVYKPRSPGRPPINAAGSAP